MKVDFNDEAQIRLLEEAARKDPRFKCVPNPERPGCYTYVDLATGLPELYPQGSTAEEAFGVAYLLI